VLSLIVVRDGVLPLGAPEVVAECAGRALLVGSGLEAAAGELEGVAETIVFAAADVTRPDLLAPHLAAEVDDDEPVVLPASPDGRDLAPHIALARRQPLFAGAIEVTAEHIVLVRAGNCHHIRPDGPFVATLQPGVRSVEVGVTSPSIRRLDIAAADLSGVAGSVTVDAVLPPDASTMDLAESSRIIGGGAGLDSPERFDQLAAVAAALDASVGATRVVTDRGWLPHERQIGTTGVVVDPRLYVALGISGAVQHTSGLGHPDHIVSVNTDPHCPMMQLADVAIVSDANAVLDELDRQLSAPLTTSAPEAGATA
jgi:electron transfer flavoprotein alpha subunit